jgi:hypothetical protein
LSEGDKDGTGIRPILAGVEYLRFSIGETVIDLRTYAPSDSSLGGAQPSATFENSPAPSPQLLPALSDGGRKDAAQQTALCNPGAERSNDAGRLILPAALDAGVFSKEAGTTQVPPGLAEDDFLTVPTVRDYAGLRAAIAEPPPQVLPTLADDDFLPLRLTDEGTQVLPIEPNLDLCGLVHGPSEIELILAKVPTLLDPVRPLHTHEAEQFWHLADLFV